MLQIIPDYKEISKILLKILQKEKQYSLDEMVQLIIHNLNLQKCDLDLKTLCGRQTIVKNRVIFAKTFLIKNGLMIKLKDKKYLVL
jgi:restriction endonuclease Mrr